jgi:hypothetical protein
MTRQLGRTGAGLHQPGPEHTPRLRLKPKAPSSGHVDGAWWPHSEDLSEELPDLLAVLSVRLGEIERVMFNLAEWAKMPRRLSTGGRSVRLDGYQRQPVNTLEVQGVDRRKILLLVVPPSTEPELAHTAMMTAAAPDNASTTADMLDIATTAEEAHNAPYRPTFHRRVRRFQR